MSVVSWQLSVEGGEKAGTGVSNQWKWIRAVVSGQLIRAVGSGQLSVDSGRWREGRNGGQLSSSISGSGKMSYRLQKN